MKLPRFRIRTLMVAPIAVAVCLWGARMWRRSAEYGELAARYRYTATITTALTINPDKEELARAAAFDTAWSATYLDLARKYEHAARYPWLPVAPDPPRPK